ncbi:MATE efflux family protein [Phocaeicola salanitronis DSM 18170]|uniref:Multidrug-efflux transporter n=1 Tax=Phocaeicola salanitronis (strain DSM 18170 / JCM 13657 / CCUG 60908 / BL78) TaxID=667015 RepID=F0R5S5_PHOSB|nr:MATE family efflux transporter [Phocaeicola salanitronis]ADY36815.1 MATE efflux family protein [Phocaeicola salanitronis DSM 18170]
MNYTYKHIWLIAFPVMMSILIEQLINITDAIFLGHVGEIELGASALAGIWYLAIYMLGFGFSLGLQVVIARRNGEQHYSETGKTFFQGLFFLSGLAVFLCLLSKLFSPMILSRLITSAEVYHAVIDYLDGRIWGLLFSFPFLALRSFLVGITQTKALNMAAFTAVLVNIPMNWFLIFGFNMGISGAAIASSFAEACSLAVLAIYVLRKMDKRLYGLHCRLDKSVLLHVCRVSVWSMFHSFIGVASWLAFFVSIEHLGEIELAATNVIRSVSTLFFVIVNSLAATTGSLVSNLLGAGQKKQVVPLCNRVVRLGYAIGLPLVILALIFYHPIISVYTDSAVLMQIAHLPFVVMLLNYAFALPGYVYINAVTGTGATRMTFIFQMITIVAYQIYLWSISCVSTSLSVYWTAEYLYVILLGVLSIIYLKYKRY